MANAAADDRPYAGAQWQENAFVVDVQALEAFGCMATGLADGTVRLRLLGKPETELCLAIQAHKNGLSGLAIAPSGKSFISIGEDGRVMRILPDGTVQQLLNIEKAWLEHIAVHADAGLIAVSYKKTVVVLDEQGKVRAEFNNHPSTVQGICFDAKGKRVAASHYGGVSLWWVNGEAEQVPQRLNWKGSHLSIAWSPNGKYLLTAMQENTLHGWRTPEFADFQMSGYAIKPKSFGWSHDNRWLASSGSPGIICWDCGGKGPMGKPATVLAQDCEAITTRIACHPLLDLVAAGTLGGDVYMARFQDDRIVRLKTNTPGEITTLRWSDNGQTLLGGCEDGAAYAWGFSD